jgi:PAS domain S-box-containing protein
VTSPTDRDVALDWFRIMADAAPVMIWMSGTDTRSFYFNQAWLDFTGRTLQEELGTGWSEVLHRDDVERCLRTYAEAFEARRSFEMECRQRRHDGEWRFVLGRGKPMYAPDGEFLGYIGSCIDVTERRRAEDYRVQLLERVERDLLLDQERKRIAYDLHDNVEQTFFAIGLTSSSALRDARPCTTCGQTLAALVRVNSLAVEGTSQLREAIRALSSAEVRDHRLAPSLRTLADNFQHRTEIEAEVAVTGSKRGLPTRVAEALHAVAREALTTVELEGRAHAVVLGLHIGECDVTLTVHDDGADHPYTAFQAEASDTLFLGLRTIDPSLRALGGWLEAGRTLDGGVLVRSQVPLDTQDSH